MNVKHVVFAPYWREDASDSAPCCAGKFFIESDELSDDWFSVASDKVADASSLAEVLVSCREAFELHPEVIQHGVSNVMPAPSWTGEWDWCGENVRRG